MSPLRGGDTILPFQEERVPGEPEEDLLCSSHRKRAVTEPLLDRTNLQDLGGQSPPLLRTLTFKEDKRPHPPGLPSPLHTLRNACERPAKVRLPCPHPTARGESGRSGRSLGPPTPPFSSGAREDRSLHLRAPGPLQDIPSSPWSPTRVSVPHQPVFKGRRAPAQGRGAVLRDTTGTALCGPHSSRLTPSVSLLLLFPFYR